MVSKHKIEMVLTWHERGFDAETAARLLSLQSDEVEQIIAQHEQAATMPAAGNGTTNEFEDVPLF
ncbi:hypothetical protein BAAM0499_06075 [Bifidobacterium animalis subsp. animalis MCC 0499]|uniref:hypothetical protein n=1 Tax=Bifidobacterium animalis TaxID=28025 RepID=UPI000699DF5E|nr:hypothetical protein [Bifidobacterium animalis]KOA61183.1 hypothetical protein BAAM0499_06075 [Bifidobacterium animalis subsp. animalis MCC 0499]